MKAGVCEVRRDMEGGGIPGSGTDSTVDRHPVLMQLFSVQFFWWPLFTGEVSFDRDLCALRIQQPDIDRDTNGIVGFDGSFEAQRLCFSCLPSNARWQCGMLHDRMCCR